MNEFEKPNYEQQESEPQYSPSLTINDIGKFDSAVVDSMRSPSNPDSIFGPNGFPAPAEFKFVLESNSKKSPDAGKEIAQEGSDQPSAKGDSPAQQLASQLADLASKGSLGTEEQRKVLAKAISESLPTDSSRKNFIDSINKALEENESQFRMDYMKGFSKIPQSDQVALFDKNAEPTLSARKDAIPLQNAVADSGKKPPETASEATKSPVANDINDQISKLAKDLESPNFQTRKTAEEKLETLAHEGRAMEVYKALLDLKNSEPGLETTRRAEQIINRIQKPLKGELDKFVNDTVKASDKASSAAFDEPKSDNISGDGKSSAKKKLDREADNLDYAASCFDPKELKDMRKMQKELEQQRKELRDNPFNNAISAFREFPYAQKLAEFEKKYGELDRHVKQVSDANVNAASAYLNGQDRAGDSGKAVERLTAALKINPDLIQNDRFRSLVRQSGAYKDTNFQHAWKGATK